MKAYGFASSLMASNTKGAKNQPETINFTTRLWRINPTNSVVIPQSLVVRSFVLV